MPQRSDTLTVYFTGLDVKKGCVEDVDGGIYEIHNRICTHFILFTF